MAPAASQGRERSPEARILTATQRELVERGRLRVRVASGETRRARFQGFVERSGEGEPVALTRRRSIRSKRRAAREVALPLTPSGRRLAARCGKPQVLLRVAGARGRRASDQRSLRPDDRRCYRVGLATRSINPDPDGTFRGEPVHLGGYGFGANPVSGERLATGILGDGIQVRAFTVSGGGGDFAIADVETHGWFVATKDAPLGLLDMRRAVEERTRGRLDAQEVVIQSDHTHGGPDSIGVWGGIPVEYRRFIFDRTVDAIVDAFDSRRRGRLVYGMAEGRDLLSNQFDYDEANEVMDSEVRVLQARDGRGDPFATLLNFSAHTNVLGSSNTKVTGDWVQATNPLLEKRFGGEAMTVVGTLGRTSPARRECPDESISPDDQEAQSLCKIGSYARRLVERAERALSEARPVTGEPEVAARSYLIQDIGSNALILGANVAGDPIGARINRALTPPWLTGNVVGTVTASARIGDVLLSGIPGEAYPQIALKVRELVPVRGHMTAGLANDQLGYLIAPYEAYPEPIRRSFFNERGDEVDPISNDNYFFNVSHTMGERVTCSLLRGAGEVFGRGARYREANGRCGLFANDLLLPAGADAR